MSRRTCEFLPRFAPLAAGAVPGPGNGPFTHRLSWVPSSHRAPPGGKARRQRCARRSRRRRVSAEAADGPGRVTPGARALGARPGTRSPVEPGIRGDRAGQGPGQGRGRCASRAEAPGAPGPAAVRDFRSRPAFFGSAARPRAHGGGSAAEQLLAGRAVAGAGVDAGHEREALVLEQLRIRWRRRPCPGSCQIPLDHPQSRPGHPAHLPPRLIRQGGA
jgi:hypothetical protein